MQVREKVEKLQFTVFFQFLWLQRVGSNLAKAAGAEPGGQMRDEKLHAVVARSKFPSHNIQNTPASEHFWKLRCRKSARQCGAKHFSKSKVQKLASTENFVRFRCCFAWQAQGMVHRAKSEQNEQFQLQPLHCTTPR